MRILKVVASLVSCRLMAPLMSFDLAGIPAVLQHHLAPLVHLRLLRPDACREDNFEQPEDELSKHMLSLSVNAQVYINDL